MLGYINNKLIIIKRHFSFRSKSTNRLEAAAAAVRPESPLWHLPSDELWLLLYGIIFTSNICLTHLRVSSLVKRPIVQHLEAEGAAVTPRHAGGGAVAPPTSPPNIILPHLLSCGKGTKKCHLIFCMKK